MAQAKPKFLLDAEAKYKSNSDFKRERIVTEADENFNRRSKRGKLSLYTSAIFADFFHFPTIIEATSFLQLNNQMNIFNRQTFEKRYSYNVRLKDSVRHLHRNLNVQVDELEEDVDDLQSNLNQASLIIQPDQ